MGFFPVGGSAGWGSAARLFMAFFFFLTGSAGSARDWPASGAVVVGAFTDGLDRVASVIAACTRRLSQPLVAVDCGMLGVNPPRTVGSISPMGTWPVENSPAGPRRHQTPLRTSRVGGGGGSGLGEVIGDRSGVHHLTGLRRFQAPS